jgi:hypothetical protein
MAGDYPFAEPVVLVDRSLAHRYPCVRWLEIVDAPADPVAAPPVSVALPVFLLDAREAMFFEGVRPATIVRDLRAL